MGRRVIGISGSLIWSKTLMELINPCGEFQWSPEGPVSQIHSSHLHVRAPGISSDLLRSVQMLKGEGVRKATVPTVFIPSKTAILVPEFAVEDLPLDRTAALVPAFALKDLSLGRKHWRRSAISFVYFYIKHTAFQPSWNGQHDRDWHCRKHWNCN